LQPLRQGSNLSKLELEKEQTYFLKEKNACFFIIANLPPAFGFKKARNIDAQ
jgi:hypothetical protein